VTLPSLRLRDRVEQALASLPVVSEDVKKQRTSLARTEHRPWPLPDEPWMMGQTWRDLLFAHWAVDWRDLRRVVPEQLPIDQFDGVAWIGITPFVVTGLRLRGTAPVPGLSSFPELNVRTYVTVDGKPGIYFMSLDADSRVAVAGARRSHRLPYFRARMRVRRPGPDVRYTSERISPDGPPAVFDATYRRSGPELPVEDGSLERWLAERYCLYTLDEHGAVLRADIHHPPWSLFRAEAEFSYNTMAAPFGIEPAGGPLLHLAPRQDTVIWGLRPVK
jgi:uncharacterized protein YqjF (DUF2071 family)